MKDRLLILAGNAAQAAQYVREKNLSTLDVLYVSGEHHVRGWTSPRYAIVGTFWDRHDAIRIWQILKLCFPTVIRKTMTAPPEIEKFLQPQLPPPPPPPPPPPRPTVNVGPVLTDFKHIKEPKPENNGFKRIRK